VLGYGGEQEVASRAGLTPSDLAGAQRREPGALTRIYHAYAPPLFRFFMAEVGHRQDANDLVGQVFLSAIESLPRFRGPVEALGGWLFKIARHDLYDYRRKQGRSRDEPLEHNLKEASAKTGTEDPEELAIDRLEGTRVMAALRRLSPDQREVLLLRFVGQMTAPEIAAAMDKTVGAVKALQHRGLANLAKALGGRGPEEPKEPKDQPYPSPNPDRLTSQGEEER
jgi:RNA polymerase sigma-70 factor (ECF subfamily)